MKTISIRFDDYLANWITSSAQKNRITISQAIRDVLYEKMQHGQIIISHIKINKTKRSLYIKLFICLNHIGK